MISRRYLAGAWSGLAFVLTMLAGLWWIAGFLPPLKSSASAEEIVMIYQANANQIRLGFVLVMIGATFYLPWTVTLSALIRRMEGKSTLLSQCQLVAGTCSAMFWFLPALIFEIAAFRPERNVELTLTLNDAGWIVLVTPVLPFIAQFLSLAIAILVDRSNPPVFPRWVGFATLGECVLFLPAMAAIFLKTGPFAWSGLCPFWLPLGYFVVWIFIIIWMMMKTIEQLSADDSVSN